MRVRRVAVEGCGENIVMASIREAIQAIEHALGPASSRMFRSPLGAMLEHAQNLMFDSTGQRHSKLAGPMMLIKRQFSEPSYEMNLSDSRTGWAVVLLGHVGNHSARSRVVLELYHGDAGARWGRTTAREQALYPLTKQGRKIVTQARKNFSTSADIRDDEIIAQDMDLQKRQPNDIRRQQHLSMRREAEQLKEDAWKLLSEAVEVYPRLASRWVG